jgi:beta-mannosidase
VAGPGRTLRIDEHDRQPVGGWSAAACPPDVHPAPAGLDGLDWLPARVPGTAAGALRDAGRWALGDPRDLDAEDWWFRTTVDAESAGAGEEVVLRLDGIATVADVFLDGEPVLSSASMFAAHAVEVGEWLRPGSELAIRCRALRPLLAVRRRPRARWRTRVVGERNLRWYRTMLLGRMPGVAPGPAAVGPWRPVVLERRRRLAVDALDVRTRVEGDDGVVVVTGRLRDLGGGTPAAAELRVGEHAGPLTLTAEAGGAEVAGELRVPGAARWWPHTHGTPALHELSLAVQAGGTTVGIDAGRVGFRALETGPDPAEAGLDLRVNGVPVFARGAVWTPPDPIGLAPGGDEVRRTLESAVAAGMNMVRVVGAGAYESPAFHDLCDELGLLVWQDLMFANQDYPGDDPDFRALVEAEARAVFAGLGGRPSPVVVCGNSESEQQAAMLGLDPAVGRGELFGDVFPRLLAESGLDAAYLPSAPCGGALPFRPDRGVANWFGVGAYRRPLSDVRRAGVRFASECLAFANAGDEPADPTAWREGVPQDAGTAWDFADVRDHYLRERYGVDPGELRFADPERYVELSKVLTGELMAEVLGEWRRGASPCRGALILWLRDRAPGAGWGVLDHAGRPKVAWHHLRRALAPVAVWTTDEGLGGVRIHVANDGPAPLAGRLRVALYAGLERPVAEEAVDIEVPAHDTAEHDVEAILGRFADAAYAYRFGSPQHDAVVVGLEPAGTGADAPGLLAVRFPLGPPAGSPPPGDAGLTAVAEPDGDGLRLVLGARRLLWGVRVAVPGYVPADDAFCLEPGRPRAVALRPAGEPPTVPAGTVTALNVPGRVAITMEG